jgi:hypothetical protein
LAARKGAGREGVGCATGGRVCSLGNTQPVMGAVSVNAPSAFTPRCYRWVHDARANLPLGGRAIVRAPPLARRGALLFHAVGDKEDPGSEPLDWRRRSLGFSFPAVRGICPVLLPTPLISMKALAADDRARLASAADRACQRYAARGRTRWSLLRG